MPAWCFICSRPLASLIICARTLPGCTLDVLKFFRKLEQLLIFFLRLLCGQTLCCWNGYSHPANVRVRSRSWSVYVTAASTNHGYEVQQVHPGLVGLGVSQREEGRQFEPHRVPSIAALKTAVTSQLSAFSFQTSIQHIFFASFLLIS